MHADPLQFRRAQPPDLVQDEVRHSEVPQVMYQSGPPDQRRLGGIKAKGRCGGGHQTGYPLRMADGVGRLNVAEVGNGLQGRVEFAVSQPVA